MFEPLGFDWQLTVGVLTSFLAREVFVSTMSVLASGQAETEVDEGVVARIRGMTRDDGGPVFTPATAAAALVFFVLAMQCLPTLAVTRKETGSMKYAALQLGYMSGLAYVVAFVLHQGLRAAGVGLGAMRWRRWSCCSTRSSALVALVAVVDPVPAPDGLGAAGVDAGLCQVPLGPGNVPARRRRQTRARGPRRASARVHPVAARLVARLAARARRARPTRFSPR